MRGVRTYLPFDDLKQVTNFELDEKKLASTLSRHTNELILKVKSTTAIKDHVLHFRTFVQKQFNVAEPDWEIVKQYFELQPFSKNEYFVRQGKVCRKLAFIAEGVTRYCMFRDDGSDVTCFLMCENDFIGDPESFFSQRPSDKNVQALTDCQLMTISYDNMQKMMVN